MKALVRAVALVLFWSSGFIGAELGARAAPPATVLVWRFLVTAVVLLPWLLRASARLDRREWMRQAVLALLCQCLYLAGVFGAAAAGVPAGTSALIASLQPALVLTAAVLLGSHRLKFGHVAGLILGSAGVALTAATDLRTGISITALALPASAMLSLAAGTLLQQRWSATARSSTPLMQTLAIQAVFSAGFFTVYTAAAGDITPPPTTQFWTSAAWAALAGIGSYGLYYLVTTRDGAARASTLLYLTPAATALWARLMFAQPLRPAAVIGLLVSATAVLVLDAAGTGRVSEPLEILIYPPPHHLEHARQEGYRRGQADVADGESGSGEVAAAG
jgi:drug/metabolite transporter (DMT)-like permease